MNTVRFLLLTCIVLCGASGTQDELKALKGEAENLIVKVDLALGYNDTKDKPIPEPSRMRGYWQAAQRCVKAITQVPQFTNDLNLLTYNLFIIPKIILFLSILVLVGFIISAITRKFIRIIITNHIVLFIVDLLLDNLPEILCWMSSYLAFIPMLNLIGLDNPVQLPEIHNQYKLYFNLFSSVATIGIIRNITISLIHRFLRENVLFKAFNNFIRAISYLKVSKICLISIMSLGQYGAIELLKQDCNQIETALTVSITVVLLLQLRNMLSFKKIPFGYIFRYISLPIVGMAVIAYTTNSSGAQFAYKLALTVLVWPLLYQIYNFIRSIGYNYLKTLPPYEIKYPIQIFLIITKIARYLILPTTIIMVGFIFSINLPYELRGFLGNSLYYKLLMTSILLLVLRITILINQYLSGVYAHINILKRPFDKQRILTSSIIIKNLIMTLIWIIATLIILSIFGFDVSPLFQTLGLFSAAMSLSLQQVIRDIVNGIFILYENSIRIGDWVDYEHKTAVVEDMSLRYMRIRMDDGLLITIPFHKLDIIKNKSRQYSYIVLNISLARQTNLDLAEKAIDEAFKNVRDRPEFKYKILKDIEMRDLADVTAFSCVMQCRICIQPNSQYKIRRAFTKELKTVFDKYEINIATPIVANATNVPSINTNEPYPDFQ